MDGGGVATCREQVRSSGAVSCSPLLAAARLIWLHLQSTCKAQLMKKLELRLYSHLSSPPQADATHPNRHKHQFKPRKLNQQVCQGADDVLWHAEAEVAHDLKQVMLKMRAQANVRQVGVGLGLGWGG